METRPDIRSLTEDELTRADAVYAELGFQLSDRAHDETFGAFEGSELVALGRIQHHPDGELEVGGFWTRPDRRGTGLARHLVAHVLAQLPPGLRTWCVPFDHLVEFYRSFGMQSVAASEVLPTSIAAKQDFCRAKTCAGKYEQTTLLVFTSSSRTAPSVS